MTPPRQPDDWTDLLAADDVPPGAARTVVLPDGRALAVCNDAGRFAVTDNACPHAGGNLGRGLVGDGHVVCPWHHWRWNLRTGQTDGPCPTRLRVYPCRVTAGRVQAHLGPPDGQLPPSSRELLA